MVSFFFDGMKMGLNIIRGVSANIFDSHSEDSLRKVFGNLEKAAMQINTVSIRIKAVFRMSADVAKA